MATTDDLSSKDVYDHVLGYVKHNTTPRQPLGLRAPTVAGGVSCITGGTNIGTVEHCLDLATERGVLVKYLDWKRRHRYAPADADTVVSIIETDDLALADDTSVDVLRRFIGAENTSAEPDLERIEMLAEAIERLEADDE